ncbi:MAG: flagellar biosynthesis protein FlhB [Betaproteobacteria bacterium]|nr:flagellar biosynthesis protein FlhB [Betaproteobacteria bacterium]
MADQDSDLEKTEDPTARKLEKAREEGQIARSKELPAAAELVLVLVVLLLAGAWFLGQTTDNFSASFNFDFRALDTPSLLPGILARAMFYGFLVIAPIFIVSFIVAIVSSSVTGGFNFTWKGLEPKFNKLNPISGIKRMVSLNALVELTKAILKFGLVATALYFTILLQIHDFMTLADMDLRPALTRSAELIGISALIVACTLVLIAMIDVPYQKHQFNERMKMTKQEVKDEMKDIEGNPEIKRKIRQRQMEMAAGRMMQKVKDADVVITNPEHFSVALAYDPNGDEAPIVLAMGTDAIAFRIREEAAKHGVEIFAAPPLARALYFTSQIDQPIHHELYYAVAQVIAYVFNMNTASADGSVPQKPHPEVPESMQFDVNGKPEKVH